MKTRPGNPVFVVGIVRSGTSLLYSLLNQHPEIALMFECSVWDFPEALAFVRFRHDWLARQEFFNRALSRHRLVYGGSLRGLENVRTPEELLSLYDADPNRWRETVLMYCGCCKNPKSVEAVLARLLSDFSHRRNGSCVRGASRGGETDPGAGT